MGHEHQFMSKIPSRATVRSIPNSLLQRQFQRTGSKEALYAASKQIRSRLVSDMFKDIISPFMGSRTTDDDDIFETKKHELLISRVKSGEIEQLLRKEYCLPNSDECCLDYLKTKFPCSQDKQVMLKTFVLQMNQQNWNDLSIFCKQLAFYQAFGPYGPRAGISFTRKQPEDFFVKCVSQLWKCTPNRMDYHSKAFQVFDPLSRIFLYMAAMICAIALIGDTKRRQNSSTQVTVLKGNS